MEMTSYKRVMTALSHKNPDRPPINYIATPEMNEKLKKHLKIEDQEELLCHLGADIRYVAARYVGLKDLVGVTGINTGGKDFWGVEWKPVENKFGTYNEISFSPLAHVKTVKEVEEYSWPNPDWSYCLT